MGKVYWKKVLEATKVETSKSSAVPCLAYAHGNRFMYAERLGQWLGFLHVVQYSTGRGRAWHSSVDVGLLEQF